jgi:(p)ppGpp synthase/HD superfamily hydrolase
MIYTEKTKKAMILMYENHKNQFDKSGIPYIFHPWHVAEKMVDEDTTIVALMHDLIEDTNITIEEISSMGFNDKVVTALSLLTHEKNTNYFEYIEKLSKNKIARKVKISDLEHNMDLTRLNEVTRQDPKRIAKYKKYVESWKYLKKLELEEEANDYYKLI